MKFLITILLLLSSTISFSQIIIRLKSPKVDKSEYIFEKASDTNYIYTTHNEDMGAWYSLDFDFRDSVPDGMYQVFIDDQLRREGALINSKKEGKWYEYFGYHKVYNIYNYHAGRFDANIHISYYKNGKIRLIEKYKNGALVSSKKYRKWMNKTKYDSDF